MTEEDLEDGIIPEVIEQNKFVAIVQTSGLEQNKAQFLLEQFQDHYKMAAEWAKKAKTIVVTNETQTVNMKMARTGRLFLREKRLEIESARKSLKESALKEGKAIDMIANFLKDLIIPTEEHLRRQEYFIELKKEADDARILAEAHAKMEAERIEKEKALAIEMEQLRKNQEEHEEQLKRERAEAKANIGKISKAANEKLFQERQRTAEVENQLRLQKQKEMKEEADKLRTAEALLKADDSVKLAKLFEDIKSIKLPDGLKSKESNIAVNSVNLLLRQIEDILKMVVIEEEV